ncbi:hypothetical protein OG2516_04029 [Oceanicola granulosus HTCC2516]|uniref:Uncharacterized protein n=1 Tax=Oceanicola granulosus (strain ATCC BAA-861 / DSM 15982 / KCTC 12143 / HTCC2516) TaxID=314256 RepID=Q2CEG3_OCEGH|nr:hypothetical protein [Oceanicola granulosus]EAR51034.1 hypothetical protein OG2516_04029 [Oceanicola granulosus HTCC2516]
MSKAYRRTGGRHVQLQEWFQATEAWTTLRPAPRALYIELKRRFNGSNNGRIPLSYREAADLINVHRNSIRAYFRELETRGLIRRTSNGHLGADGHGIATTWQLCELAMQNGGRPDLAFRSWEKQKPVTNVVHLRHNHCAGGAK